MRCGFALVVALWAAVALGAQEDQGYLIGARDELQITVFDEPELDGQYIVDADGTIDFPWCGRIEATGVTVRDMERRIESALRSGGFLRRPQVSVVVTSYQSQRVYVMGEVRTPGRIPLEGRMTLVEALARAGFTTLTGSSEVLVIRPARPESAGPSTGVPHDDGDDVVRVSLNQFESGGLGQDFALKDGDTIYVPRVATVFVTGHVLNPGEYQFDAGLTIRQAIALAGGVTDRGSTGRIQVLREVNGESVEVSAELDDAVRPEDTIIVRQRFF